MAKKKSPEKLGKDEMLILAGIMLEEFSRFVKRKATELWTAYSVLAQYDCIDSIEKEGMRIKGLALSCEHMSKYLDIVKRKLYGGRGKEQKELREKLQLLLPSLDVDKDNERRANDVEQD